MRRYVRQIPREVPEQLRDKAFAGSKGDKASAYFAYTGPQKAGRCCCVVRSSQFRFLYTVGRASSQFHTAGGWESADQS